MLFDNHEKSLLLGRDVFDRLRQLYSADSLDGELAKLREEMHETIKSAVISHESRVVKSHNGMAAIAIPIVVLIAIVVGIQSLFTLECPREIIIQQLKGQFPAISSYEQMASPKFG